MAAISFAIIGKNNEPLYLKEFDDSLNTSISEEEFFGVSLSTPRNQISLKHEFLLHAALDRLEQVAGPPPGYGWRKSSDSLKSGMFVGLLCPHEEVRVYGYVTTTKIVFLLTVEDDSVPEMQQSIDNEIKSLMTKLHEAYIEDSLNPFKDIGSAIVSQTFERKVQMFVSSFNNLDGTI